MVHLHAELLVLTAEVREQSVERLDLLLGVRDGLGLLVSRSVAEALELAVPWFGSVEDRLR